MHTPALGTSSPSRKTTTPHSGSQGQSVAGCAHGVAGYINLLGSISHTLSGVKSGGGAAYFPAVAGLIACKDMSLCEAFSGPWPPSSPFYKLLEIERHMKYQCCLYGEMRTEHSLFITTHFKAYICLPGRMDSHGIYTDQNFMRRLFLPHERSRSACKAQRAMAGPAMSPCRHLSLWRHKILVTLDPPPHCHRGNAPHPRPLRGAAPPCGLAQALHSPRAARRVHGCAALGNAMAGRSLGL